MKFHVIILAALVIGPLAPAQKLELKLDDIASKASKKNEIDLDGPLLKTALANLPQVIKSAKGAKDKGDTAALTETKIPALLSALTGVYVRNYGFDKPGAYADSDLDAI